MSVFVDTSGMYAVLDRDDAFHTAAREVWSALLAEEESIVLSNYVLVECCALVQNRLGMDALRTLTDDVLPVVATTWVSEEDHRAGLAAVLAADRRELSLVDCTSFEVMRRLGCGRGGGRRQRRSRRRRGR